LKRIDKGVIHVPLLINKGNHKNILLAGKSFFCKRFYLLASIYANEDKVLDVLPLQDDREIIPAKWVQSEKGRVRILNEIEQYSKILQEKSSVLLELE
jgi:hypothetical protein